MIDVSQIIKDHPLLESYNTALGRTIEISSEEKQRGEWTDTKQITLPSFLTRSMKSQFMSSRTFGDKDVLISSLLKDVASRTSFFLSLDIIMKELTALWSEQNALPKQGKTMFISMAASSNLSEITKQQLLVGAPVLGHPLSGGGHFVHSTPPSGFSIPENVSKELGVMFRKKFGTCRKAEFTVPASTSQGLILKSRQDSPQWRVYSKALMAELASRATNRDDYEKFAEILNTPFTERGFYGPAKDFYLGMRKQASRKGEVVGSERSYDLSGDYGAQETVAVQGRLRGIFPPSEYTKIFFKPFAEGIKSSLFKHAPCTFVDLSYISSKLHFIAYKTYFKNLLDKDETLLCFYDLDKMDTTTHGGFFDIYRSFCEGVFPDFSQIEGDMVKDSGLIFPASIYSDDVFLQDVRGRSTLSGQPDVTTKNNVCHLLAMSYCIGIVLNQSFESVFHALCEGNVPLSNGIIPVVHLHGDDTMMYFSDDVSDYKSYYSELAKQGFETSCERSPAFLKKTLCSFDSPTVEADDKLIIGIQLDILKDKISDKKSDVSDKLKSIFSAYGVFPNTSSYNEKYVGFMNPIAGSLVRNRCGEYEVKDVHLLLMALSDTSKMVDAIAPAALKDYWFLIYNSVVHEYDLSMLDISSSEAFFSSIQSDTVQEIVRAKLIELASESISKASLIKDTLEKMYYASGEDLNDEQLQTIFGSLFVTNVEMSERFNLRSLSLKDLTTIIQRYQSQLLDSSGVCPIVDDEISRVANDILKVI